MRGGEYKAEVWGRQQNVSVHQESKSVFIATGEYLGQSITVKGRSVGQALKAWKNAATYRGN